MESVVVHLHKAREAEDSYAIGLENDGPGAWRAERGVGGHFEKVWSVELAGGNVPPFSSVDWEAVLDRVIEAWDMSDPVISPFEWPRAHAGTEGR